ncbi:hypothetical protein C1H76_8197 [Elsinoe australis]|uniref:Uncharacterized protein n=1 Tax=Elsinoe australis TaxID=40998 RepID=A0A4U7ARI7_9PEZI|nr:hypothetical protein C1H76_8197 [Elsinoe australis]
MDSFTLYTFNLKAPAHARTVELYGSWDNFSQPWRLHRDTLRGRSFWTGCHKFENIVFDGIKPDWNKPRNGALKQGGRYWYFYRLDDADEYCDPANPTTTDCPLLPGQLLNVLDVPIEIVEKLPRGRSASVDIAFIHQPVMTLDPEARYKKIKRQPPKLMRHYASSDGLESNPSSTPASPSIPKQSSNESFKSSAAERKPVARRAKSFVSHRASNQMLHDCPSPSPLGRSTGVATTTPLSRSAGPFSSQGFDSDVLRPFAPTARVEDPVRPQTRPGSDSASSISTQSFYTVNSKPSFFTEKALPSLPNLPPGLNPTTQDQGLGISMQQQVPSVEQKPAPILRSKPSRNFARPFYAHAVQANQVEGSTTSPVLPPPADDSMDFSFTGMAVAYPSPRSETTSFGMASPTFTADTVSTPGFTTPHRLSAQFQFDLHSEHLDLSLGDQIYSEHAIDDVERRLSRLQTGDDGELNTLFVSPQPGRSLSQTPSPFLKHPDAALSDVTLKKLPTPKPNAYIGDENIPPSPSPIGSPKADMSSPSLANKIFGELGFLGRAIH